MGIGANIKAILKENNMTIAELSKKSGVSINTLYSITKRDPDNANIDTLQKIADALNCFLIQLYDEDNIPLYATYDTLKELNDDDDITRKICALAFNLVLTDIENLIYTIKLPDGELLISRENLEKLDYDTDNYLRFKLEEYKQGHLDDFKPFKK